MVDLHLTSLQKCMWRGERACRPEHGGERRKVDASGAWTNMADRSEAPHAARMRTDGRRCGSGEEGKADGEDAPSRATALGAGRSRAPEHYRRDGATPQR